MTKKGLFILVLAFAISCKKKTEPAPPDAPPVTKTGAIKVKIQTFDSLGEETADFDGIRFILSTTQSVSVGANGQVIFGGLKYGDYFPSALRDGWEGPPFKLSLSSDTAFIIVPFAKRTAIRTKKLTAQIVKKDSIIVNFDLEGVIPAGKSAKLALIAGATANINNSSYESVDIFFTNSSSVNQLNIAKFARFKNYVAGLDSNTIFYINVLPVSYGEYVSNMAIKPLLLGDNPFAPDNWLLKKDWKK